MPVKDLFVRDCPVQGEPVQYGKGFLVLTEECLSDDGFHFDEFSVWLTDFRDTLVEILCGGSELFDWYEFLFKER